MKNPCALRTLVSVCMAMLPLFVCTQVLTTGEYFFNTDPGFGMGVPFVIGSPNDTINASVSVNTASLPPGRHILYTRCKGDNGVWGITRTREIRIVREIISAEYFWNLDPGQGNGIPLEVYDNAGTAAVCDDMATTGLTPGPNSLYVRFRSADGAWSIPSRTDVTITANTTPIGCPGDFDANGSINTTDLLILLGGFGDVFNCDLDLTGDFAVNTSDLLIFLGNFSVVCP